MPYGLSTEEVEWLREQYRMFREGDPAFLEPYAPDAKLSFPATLPAGGSYDNPVDALEFPATMGELFDAPYPDPKEFLRVEDRLVVLGTWRARSRQSGEEIAVRIAHVYRLSGKEGPLMDQKVVSLESILDTAAVLQALDDSRPAASE